MVANRLNHTQLSFGNLQGTGGDEAAREVRLRLKLGWPSIDSTRLSFDKERGALRIERRTLIGASEEDIRLSAILDVYVMRRRRGVFARYLVVLVVLGRDRVAFTSMSGAEAKRAVRQIRAILR